MTRIRSLNTFRRLSMLLAGMFVASIAAIALQTGPASAAVCTNWSRSISGGLANGTNCVSGQTVTVSGKVKDTASDGYCVYIRVSWAQSPTQDSPAACPQGDTDNFSLSGQGNSDITIHRYRV
jgi:hypothetical protein